jgi:hypothetical protein
VQMAKSDPDAQRKTSLSDYTWLENEFGSFNLETLKFLMHFREPGSSLYFVYIIHTHIFFYFHIYILFSFSLYSFSLFFPFSFFLCSP